MSIPDPVNHPEHYLTHKSGVECIQITEHLNFCLGNALKYIWRADSKGDAINDLSKAVWYLEREITRRKALADIENARLIGVIADCLDKDLVTKSDSSPDADARRQYEMGNACAYGDGMPKDLDHAREWWRLAAAQGHAEAQSALDVYELRTPAPLQTDDPDEIIKVIQMQAAGGDKQAQLYLAEGYAHGWYGLIRSSYMSCLWRNRANEPRTEEADVATVIPDPLADMRARAEAGDRHAQRTLGDAYAHGMEVAQDRAESDRWYAMASAPSPTEEAQ